MTDFSFGISATEEILCIGNLILVLTSWTQHKMKVVPGSNPIAPSGQLWGWKCIIGGDGAPEGNPHQLHHTPRRVHCPWSPTHWLSSEKPAIIQTLEQPQAGPQDSIFRGFRDIPSQWPGSGGLHRHQEPSSIHSLPTLCPRTGDQRTSVTPCQFAHMDSKQSIRAGQSKLQNLQDPGQSKMWAPCSTTEKKVLLMVLK